jgi:hypothetical protein
MCQRGAIMSEIADVFGVSIRTIWNWLNQHNELRDAVQVGVDAFNARVERALAERAIGFWITIREEVRDEQGKVIQRAAAVFSSGYASDHFFLKNRARDKWRDVQDHNVNARAFKSLDESLVEISRARRALLRWPQ